MKQHKKRPPHAAFQAAVCGGSPHFTRMLSMGVRVPCGLCKEIKRLPRQGTLCRDLKGDALLPDAGDREHIERSGHIDANGGAKTLKILFELCIHANADAGLCQVNSSVIHPVQAIA